MSVMFVCGGTAGHIYPALAVAEGLRDIAPNTDILFVGSGRELENRLVPEAGYKLVNIKMSGLRRGFSPPKILYNIRTVKNLVKAKKEAGKLIGGFKAGAVIGTGGYICYPVLKKASEMGIPTLIHESNAVPGLATKMLSPYVDKVLVSYPDAEVYYRNPQRVIFTGTPVRDRFRIPQKNEKSAEFKEKPMVVSFWGSLGSQGLSEVTAQLIKLNIDGGQFRHIHAAGKSKEIRIIEESLQRIGVSGSLPPDIELLDYIDDMPSVMAAADLVLCRAGASTLAELAVMAKPAVLVPSPNVTNDHQTQNAMRHQQSGGVVVVPERDCTGQALFDTVTSILKDNDRIKKMSEAQKNISVPDAAENIVELILSYL